MSSQPELLPTPEEYLARERLAVAKSEYWDGQALAMAGASYEHNLIVANIIGAMHPQLRDKPCRIFPSDLRVWIAAARRFVYPDVTVLCQEPLFFDEQRDTLLNPTLIFEVLSEATKDYDRGEKFMLYRTLASLKEYVLIAQDPFHVEHFIKQDDGRWLLGELQSKDERLFLETTQSPLALVDIYEGVGTSSSRGR